MADIINAPWQRNYPVNAVQAALGRSLRASLATWPYLTASAFQIIFEMLCHSGNLTDMLNSKKPK